MMHERYTNPFLVGIYVISVHHTAFGDLGEKFLCDLRSSINVLAFFIDIFNGIFDSFFAEASGTWLTIKPVIIPAF